MMMAMMMLQNGYPTLRSSSTEAVIGHINQHLDTANRELRMCIHSEWKLDVLLNLYIPCILA